MISQWSVLANGYCFSLDLLSPDGNLDWGTNTDLAAGTASIYATENTSTGLRQNRSRSGDALAAFFISDGIGLKYVALSDGLHQQARIALRNAFLAIGPTAFPQVTHHDLRQAKQNRGLTIVKIVGIHPSSERSRGVCFHRPSTILKD